MVSPRLRNLVLIAAGAAGLSACADYGNGYGYGGMSVGYGTAGYCDPYYSDCYAGYGYGAGYGDPWYGWWGDYYYPGIGFFVFDSYGRRYRWNDNQRHYWEGRRGHWGNRNWNDQSWQRWDGYRQQGGQGNWSGQNRNWNGGTRNWQNGSQGQNGARGWN